MHIKPAMTQFLRMTWTAAIAGLVCLQLAPAHAQGYPNRPVRIVVPAGPGDGSDVLARTLAKSLGESLGQPFVIDNKPGAGGSLAADAVAKAAPDGYTIFLANGSTHGPTPSLYPNLPYDSLQDFVPVTMISSAANVLVVGAGVQANGVGQFIALAKKQPGKLTIASAGNGSISHLSAEMFKAMAGIDLMHVPYKGASPALLDIASGQVDAMIINIPTVLPLLQGGKLRILGVTSLKPAASLPSAPTLDASGVPGYETTAWFGFMVPARTPPVIVQTLYAKTRQALAQPEVKATLARQGAEPADMTPAEFAVFVRGHIAKYARVIKDAKVKLE